MKRRVIQQNPTTLVISLPAKWAKENSIKKGDELEVEEKAGRVTFSLQKKPELKTATLDIKSLGQFNKNYISYLYHLGYDEIRINFGDAGVFRQIEERVSQLIGFAILSQTETSCIVRAVSAGLEGEFDAILRRVFLILLDMADNCLDAVSKNELGRLDEILLMEKNNNQLTDLCIRILVKNRHIAEKEMFFHAIVRELEKIADHYKYICGYIAKSKVKSGRETIRLFKDVNSYVRNFYELFYKFDAGHSTRLNEGRLAILTQAERLFMKVPQKEAFLIHLLIGITRSVYEMRGPYFETML